MNMDSKYNHNTIIPLTFTYGADEYNGYGPDIRFSALNWFKDPLGAPGVTGGLNDKLPLCLVFHSDHYICSTIDHVKWTFAR